MPACCVFETLGCCTALTPAVTCCCPLQVSIIPADIADAEEEYDEEDEDEEVSALPHTSPQGGMCFLVLQANSDERDWLHIVRTTASNACL